MHLVLVISNTSIVIVLLCFKVNLCKIIKNKKIAGREMNAPQIDKNL